MNNHRLLTGLLVVSLWSGGVCVMAGNRQVVTMEELFRIAETNSAQLRPSFTAEEVARQEISVARSKYLPDIEANLSFSYIGDGFTTKRNLSDYQKAEIPHFGNNLGVSVSQPVYTGGALTAGVKLAKQKASAANYSTEMQRDNIRLRLAGFYLDIYKYDNLRDVVENNIIQARQVLEDMKARYEQGMALQNDITRYELLVSNLELQLVKINNTLTILNRNLVVTAGLPENTEIVPDSTIIDRALPKTDEEWWHETAKAEAPSLKLARTGVDISKTAESLVRSERLPKIGLKAAWSMDGPILVEIPPIDRNLSYWYVGVGISYNLSSLYKSNKSLAKSRVATREAVERLEAANENVDLDVRAGYVRYMEAFEELKTQRKSVELAERNYNIVSTRYTEGMALITDMLDAANSKLDAEQMLVNARINIIQNYYRLLYTSGKI